MKRCIGSAKHHRIVFRFFERYYDAKEVIHKRISWNPENISKSGPKIRPKIKKIESSMKRCIGSAKHHRNVFRFFERYYDAKEVIHKRIYWNPENISKSRPKVRPKILENWTLIKRCIGSAKHHRTVFRYFDRYYDAKEVIHKRSSWNQENISKSGPKIRPKIKKIESSMKRCIGSPKHHKTMFRFFERYYDAKEVIHKRISWNPEHISKSGPKVRPKIKKIEF